jgi:hypothetical protein
MAGGHWPARVLGVRGPVITDDPGCLLLISPMGCIGTMQPTGTKSAQIFTLLDAHLG